MRATFRSFVMVLALALVGCASPVTLTDVATVNRPGRHEVYLPGSGVTLGGILFRSDNKATAVPAIVVLHGWETTVCQARFAGGGHGATPFGTGVRLIGALYAGMAAFRRT